MEFDNDKFREDLTCQQPPILLPNIYLKDEIDDDDFCFESKGGFFQDLHHLDHDFSFTGLSLSPDTDCLDPFDPFPNVCSLNCDDFYESKPFDECGGNGISFSAMQNFDSGGGGCGSGIGVAFDCQDVKPVSFVIPDEGSCITAENGYYKGVGVKKSSNSQTRKTGKNRKKSTSVKGQWTSEEDRLLIHLVEKFGVRKWSQIAQLLKGRIGKQCRERWHNHLRPDIKKDTWSEEEDRILIQAHLEVGNKWAEIAKRLAGRTENSIKNHWNATKRRQYSRRKCRTKYPRPSSLLQNYIKSLHLDPTNLTAAAAAAGLKFPPPNAVPPPRDTAAFCGGDRLVPDFDLEVPGFDFGENLFEGSASIDSLLDQMPDDRGFEMDVCPLDMASFMDCEVKKEMDLVEMITQVNL